MVKRNQLWKLEPDPKVPLCYRIYNHDVDKEKSKIILWSTRIGMYDGDGFNDNQLWKFWRQKSGYYSIINCGSNKRMTLGASGSVFGSKGGFDDDRLWNISSVENYESK